TRPSLPVTVMGKGPVGVLVEVVRVRVVEHVGVQEGAEKEALAPAGSPEAEKATDRELPETRVAVMVFVTDEPWVTDLSPPFDSEKSNGAVTVRVKLVVWVTQIGRASCREGVGLVGVLVEVVRVRVVEHVGVAEGGVREGHVPVVRTYAHPISDRELPETRVAVMVFVTDEPRVTDLSPPFDSEKSNGAVTVRVKLVVWVT